MRLLALAGLGLDIAGLGACGAREARPAPESPTPAERLARYTEVALEADTSTLSPAERRMIPLLVEAAKAMNDAYWLESYPARDSLLATLEDSAARRMV
ncbi:MAG TPA: hypothetical protein VFN96_03885, partial [Gemmatimonadales bacterium]|nr:hypothetical protein [Gemmatimonadales bacterium]